MSKVIYMVHCIDTEGPLFESLTATFERIYKTFNLQYTPSLQQLARLKQGLDLPQSLRASVMDFISDGRLDYKKSWTEVDEMVRALMDQDWRMQYVDDFGFGYCFSWFTVDHVGYDLNPRNKALGYHAVFQFYKDILKEYKIKDDKIYWHNHPVSFFKEANKTSNNFSHTNHHVQVLNRRIIDHLYFPAAYRPGCHCERPDINLFLEQWIPFDFGNQGMPERIEDAIQQDLSHGRYGDWRRAPSEWSAYHPDFYDYQLVGRMKRWIARSLNLDCRVRPITELEIHRAFQRADNELGTILSVTSHDYRELRGSIDWYFSTVKKIQKLFPDVKIRHINAVGAMRNALNLSYQDPIRFITEWDGNRLIVSTDKVPFGPQPWLCFRTHGGQYIHENFDFQIPGKQWSYVFDDDTVKIQAIDCIGLATNDAYGNTTIANIRLNEQSRSFDVAFLNSNYDD